MKKLLLSIISCLLLCVPALSQTFNVDQIRPSTTNTWVITTVGGHTVWAPAPGGSSLCGPLGGDTLSTNCGTGNFTGTSLIQGQTVDQAYGSSNLLGSPGLSQGVAIGADNLNNDVGTGEDEIDVAVAIGLSNGTYLNTGGSIVGIGQNNAGGVFPSGSTNVFEIVASGDSNASTIGNNVDDVIATGDGSANTIPTGSHDIIANGDAADKQCATFSGCGSLPNPIAVHDVIAQGDTTLSFNQGSDVAAVGNQAMGSNAVGAAVGFYNQGNFNYAFGSYSLVGNSTGQHNSAFGGYSGSDGYTGGTTFGHSNHTGSDNSWFGYDSGPGVTAQLSNTSALGSGAHNNKSNQVVLGNPSVIETVINGTIVNNGTAPSPSSGSVTGTNADGQITGLSTATSVTLTFANSGWANFASCVAITSEDGNAASISAISTTSVTFDFSSLTGTLYYHCGGN